MSLIFIPDQVLKLLKKGVINFSDLDEIITGDYAAIKIIKERYKKEKIIDEIRWIVWERDDFTCKYCGSRKDLQVDHVKPEVLGGKTILSNLQTLCKKCNCKKGKKWPVPKKRTGTSQSQTKSMKHSGGQESQGRPDKY